MKCSFKLSKGPMEVDKVWGSKMSIRMLMSVSWILLHAWSGFNTTSATYGVVKIPKGYCCEGVIGCKQTLLSLSRYAIFLGRSELFFKQKCCFLSNRAPLFQCSNPLWNFRVCAWVVLSFFFCVFSEDFLWNAFNHNLSKILLQPIVCFV